MAGKEGERDHTWWDPEGATSQDRQVRLCHWELNDEWGQGVKLIGNRTNTWIYVSDMKLNIFVGIKTSGVFQHSSCTYIPNTRTS